MRRAADIRFNRNGRYNMAAKKRINKEIILDAAYELVRKEGFDSLSARKVAKEAGCSTQPIYENYHDMGVIIEHTLKTMKETYSVLKEKLRQDAASDYAVQAVAICEFAVTEKVLFRFFVMEDSEYRDKDLFADTNAVDGLIKNYGLGENEARSVDEKMRKYILGLSFMVNTGYIQFDKKEIEKSVEEYLGYVK